MTQSMFDSLSLSSFAKPQRAAVPATDRAELLLEGLNDAQRAAVQSTASQLLVVAGAGSGKTRVLTHRIAYLLATGRAHPGSVLAITFTNKAAAEMRERIGALIGSSARHMWIATFHSACARLLRYEAKTVGLPSQFSIYDTADSLRMMTLVCRDLSLDPKRSSPKSLLFRMSALKNELIDCEEYASTVGDNAPEQDLSAAYTLFTERMRAAGALDFDDLIMTTVNMFRAFPDVAERYRQRFGHILVDEYQDTNLAQYALVRELMSAPRGAEGPGGQRSLTVVGDSDQSIYAFRGATIRNILEFEQDYPGAETITLEQNYRSTQNILSAANAIIEHNEDRPAKNLWTAQGAGPLLQGYVADDDRGEASYIADRVDELRDDHGISYGDVAVFYRTNAQSRSIEEVLMRRGIPYKVVGGTKFYDRKEIKDIMAYLRALVNPADVVSLRRIVNVPKRGIGERAETALAAYSEREGIPLSEAIERADRIPGLAARSAKAVSGFAQIMRDLRTVTDNEASIATVVEAVLERTGYLAALQESSDPQDETRVENLEELLGVASEFDQAMALANSAPASSRDLEAGAELVVASDPQGHSETPDAVMNDGQIADAASESAPQESAQLAEFLERVALVADADQVPANVKDEGVVTLMTLHTAKGLEFPVVFLTGMEEGIFPHYRSLDDPAELAEERRLAYVGITRARQRLHLTLSARERPQAGRRSGRSSWGDSAGTRPSQFLREIPENLIEWSGDTPAPSAAGVGIGSPATADSFGAGSGSTAAPSFFGTAGHGRGRTANSINVSVGDRVTHDSFGVGTVVDLSGSGDNAVAHVDFHGEIKLLLLRYSPVEKL